MTTTADRASTQTKYKRAPSGFSAEQRASFDRDGILVLPGAIEPDDERSRRALEPLLARDLHAAIAAFDEVGFLADDNPSADGASSVVTKRMSIRAAL